MQANDYTSAFANVPNPAQAFAQSFAGGAQLRQVGLQQDAMQVKAEQDRMAMEQAQRMQAELAQLSANPTPQAIAAFSVRYPQLSEHSKRNFDMLDTQQRQNKLSAAIPVYAAALSGRSDVAVAKLTEQADAMEAAGQPQEAAGVRQMATMMQSDPASALIHAGTFLAGVLGPEKFAETFGKLQTEARATAEAPADLRKKNADADKAGSDATTAAVTAKYANSQALMDLEKKGWDIKALQNDIEYKRQANRIAAMNAATAKETNGLKRDELRLKVAEAKQKLDGAIREKAQTAEAGASAIDNMLNTIERIKKAPGLRDVIGSFEGSALYPTQVMATANALNPLVSSGDDRADAIALIETLGSQAFLSQLPNIKGMGALSNAEGDKLQAALQNLSRKQSEKQFNASLEEAARLLIKGRETLSKGAGVPLGKPDTPAAPSARPPLTSFMK